jgi:hypothetical protein
MCIFFYRWMPFFFFYGLLSYFVRAWLESDDGFGDSATRQLPVFSGWNSARKRSDQ